MPTDWLAIITVLALAAASLAFAEPATTQPADDARQALAREAWKMLDLPGADTFRVIQLVAAPANDPLVAVNVFGDLQNQCYWKRKSVPLSTAMGRAGIQYGLTEAARLDATDKAKADAIRAVAKGCAYDLGSFNWIGWDEPGYDPATLDDAVGRDAAKTNLRLAYELDKPDIGKSRAHWLVGAYHLSAGDRPAAAASFNEALELARKANEKADELLCTGYILLAARLESPNDVKLIADYEAVKAGLKALKMPDVFIDQLDAACKVFSTPKK
jgi:hypothetical protein